MEFNVYNMPENKLYQFDKNRFVWKIKLNETRHGNYKGNNYSEFTEVFQMNNGVLSMIASGHLNNNSDIIKNNEISIFNYDDDTMYTYSITMPLKEADVETLNKLREFISESYKHIHK